MFRNCRFIGKQTFDFGGGHVAVIDFGDEGKLVTGDFADVFRAGKLVGTWAPVPGQDGNEPIEADRVLGPDHHEQLDGLEGPLLELPRAGRRDVAVIEEDGGLASVDHETSLEGTGAERLLVDVYGPVLDGVALDDGSPVGQLADGFHPPTVADSGAGSLGASLTPGGRAETPNVAPLSLPEENQ